MTDNKANPKNILLVALTRLGDMLQASPTIAGLKKQYPDARITVLIEKNFSSVCRGIPGIDELAEIDFGYVYRNLILEGQGIVDAFAYTKKFIDDLRQRNFDYCLNMSASGFTAMILNLLDIKDSRGWRTDDEGTRIISTPWAQILAAFLFHANREYNAINVVDLFRCSAGVTEHPRKLVYSVTEEARDFASSYIAEKFGKNSSGPLICVQAGASQIKRQWHPGKFIQLIQMLVKEIGARVILTGSKGELPIIEPIVSGCKDLPVVSAAGETNLAELAGLLEKADILITGDTGPMHLSVAVGTPVVSLFLASAYAFETGPYGIGNIVVQPNIECNPCNPNFSCGRPDCHEQVTPELITYLTQLRLNTSAEDMLKLEISPERANPRDVTILVSCFDDDGFLDFRPISKLIPRKGYPGEFPFIVRNAYRELWKGDFGGYVKGNLPLVDRIDQYPVEGVARSLEKLALQGQELIGQLVSLIKDLRSPPRFLGETSKKLAELDEEIQEFGLGNPIYGPLIRMFVLEKENMRGNDPLILASEMGGLYRKLGLRADKFSRLCRYFETTVGKREQKEEEAYMANTSSARFQLGMEN